MRFALGTLLAAALAAPAARAQLAPGLDPTADPLARPEPPARAELLADVAAIRPGEPFRLGVRFRIRPEWHLYWRYPGDAGLATEVRFHLPEGFQVSTLRWPVPKTFTQPGDIVGYGYEDELLLWAIVRAPEDLSAQEVTVRATASWLACREVCLPGQAEPTLTLPVARIPRPGRHRRLFDAWQQRLPFDPNNPDAPLAVQAADVPAAGEPARVVVTWHRPPPPRLDWIPALPPSLAVAEAAVTTEGRRTTITVRPRPLAGQAMPAHLESLLTWTDAEGPGPPRGVRIDIPLRTAGRDRSEPSDRKLPKNQGETHDAQELDTDGTDGPAGGVGLGGPRQGR